MSQIKNFKDFGIVSQSKNFTGEKISIDQILNQPITVYDFVIKDSKYKDKGNGKCLYIQITYEDRKRVLFTGSANLMETINKVNKDDFPFLTTIRKENKRLEFN